MSNIFTAIRKQHGEICEVILPMMDGELELAPPLPVDEDTATVQAVLEDDGFEPQGKPEITREAPAPSFRQFSLRLPAAAPLLPFDGTNSVAAEQYRLIRTKLIQHLKRPRMLLISSAGPSDGKTVTAINLAGALSLKAEAKVLLLDTDFRRSSIHLRLGLPASPGLADILSGTVSLDEALMQTEEFPNLHVISAGQPQSNPSELLDSSRWAAVCNELRSRFAYVIADSPPVASVADYDLLQAACDGVLLVVRPDHTKREAVLKVLENIPSERLIGVVMNCVEDWFLSRDPYGPYYADSTGPRAGRAAGRK